MGIRRSSSQTVHPSRPSRWARRRAGGAVLCGVGVLLLGSAALAEGGGESQDLVPAVHSPTDSPACAAGGLATLVVPTERGVLDDALATGSSVDVTELVGNATTPTLIFCGKVAAGEDGGTECELDDQFEVIAPDDGTGESSAPVGGIVDAVGSASPEAGEALGEALGCRASVPSPGTPGAASTIATAAVPAPVTAPHTTPGTAFSAPPVTTPASAGSAVSTDQAEPGSVSQPALPTIPSPSSNSGRGHVIAGIAALTTGGLWMGARRGTVPLARA